MMNIIGRFCFVQNILRNYHPGESPKVILSHAVPRQIFTLRAAIHASGSDRDFPT